jgi:hypothetical protein
MNEQSATELIYGLSKEDIRRIFAEGEAAYHDPEWTMNPYRHAGNHAELWRAGWKAAEMRARTGKIA